MEIRFTIKQIEILNAIRNGNADGSRCDVYDLMSNVSYDCKRDAMLHSIRVLVQKGFVQRGPMELRGGKQCRTFLVTTKALEYL